MPQQTSTPYSGTNKPAIGSSVRLADHLVQDGRVGVVHAHQTGTVVVCWADGTATCECCHELTAA